MTDRRQGWADDAERDADATRAPSGYYPTARILDLLAEVDRLTEALEAAQSVAQRDEAEKGRLWQHLRDRCERAEADAEYLQQKWDAENARAIGAEHDLAEMTAEQARSQAHVAQAERELADEKRRHAESERHTRDEWADYFERWTQAVGPEPLTVEVAIRLLRAELMPFGVATGEPT